MNTSAKTVKYILVSLMAGLLSFAALASPEHHERRLIKALDLTQDQVTQLKALRAGHKEQRQQGREAMKAIKEKKQALLINYDQTQADAIAEEIATMHKARVLKKLAHQHAIYTILNDDQKQKFVKLMAKHSQDNHKKRKMKKMHDQEDD